jgi:hypothetical protein
MANVERGACRFKAVKGPDGKATVQIELFHNTVKLLDGMSLEFELLSGSTIEQARALADAANDRVLGVIVSKG